MILCSSDEHEAGIVSVGAGERAALSGSRFVHERGGASAGRLLRSSGHTPARGHPSLIRPVPGQTRLRGFQRAPAHVALLHEGSVFGGRRLAAGSRAGVFPPEAARDEELTTLEMLQLYQTCGLSFLKTAQRKDKSQAS